MTTRRPGGDADAAAGPRSRILDAAAEAFMRAGFAGTTIDDIARDVGATKGLVYYHYPSKFDILLAVFGEAMRRVRERVEPYAAAPGTGRDRLVAMSVAHVANLMESIAYHHVVHQAVRGEPAAALKGRQRAALHDLNRLRRDYESMFRRVVDAGIADGSLRRVDAALATRTLLTNLNALDLWYRTVDGQTAGDRDELARRVVDLLIGGLSSAPVP